MANLIDFSTMKSKVDNYKKIYGIVTPSLTFNYICLEAILNLAVDEIEDSITEGYGDRGIDALYINDASEIAEIHIFQCKYTEKSKNIKKNFPGGEIDKLITIIQDVLDEKKSLKKEVNDILWDKIKTIWAILKKKRAKYYLYLCNNALPPIKSERERLTNTLDKYRDFSVNFYGIGELLERIIEKKKKKINSTIQFVGRQYFERSDGNIRGVIATIESSTLVEMIKDPENDIQILDDILDDNVRIYLKSTNPINKRIIESALSDDNYEFWYLNNGITMTCDKIDYTPNINAPIVELRNVQIVNGGQTTNAIFEAYRKNETQTKNVNVLVRIYETTRNTITQKITESTNSQTPVRTRDLKANYTIMKKLEEELSNMGFYYERKKNMYQTKPSSKRIDAEQAAQAYMAFYLEEPAAAKSKKASIFAERFDDIFNDEISAIKLLIPFILLKEIEQHKKILQSKIRREKKYNTSDIFLLHASFHILTVMKFLADNTDINLTWDNKDKLIALYKSAKDAVMKVVKQEEKREDYSHNNFFKDTKTIIKIKESLI